MSNDTTTQKSSQSGSTSMCKPFEEWPEVMTVTDIQVCLDIPRDQAYQMFKRPDFPLLVPEAKKSRKVHRVALREHLQIPRRRFT